MKLTDEQREAIKWAVDQAYIAALGRPLAGAEAQRWLTLRVLLTTHPVADAAVAPKGDRDTSQLTDWLLTDPQTGEKLRFAGPLEPDFLRFSRVKLQGKSGAIWTLSARLEEGYLTAEERYENIKRAAQEAAND